MRFSSAAVLLGLALRSTVLAGGLEDKKPKLREPQPCTIASETGSFYDLRTLSITPPEDGKKAAKGVKTNSWHAKGHDYKANFTLNVCTPVLEDIKEIYGVGRKHWQNVSAYYDFDGKTYSLG